MSIVVTCGQEGSGYSLAQSALTLAGVSPPNLFRHGTFTAEELTSRICTVYKTGKNGVYSQITPGPVWQALSVDMALANLDQKSWGWADPNSVHLLNYWRDFDPRFNFVLVYSSPEYHLAQILDNGSADPQAIQEALGKWRAYNEELLRFYSANSERAVLVNVESLLENPVGFLSACGERLKLDLKRINTPIITDDERVSAFALLSASALLAEVPEAQALFEELESAGDLPRTARQDREAMMSRAQAEHRELSARFAALSARVAELTAERDGGRRANDLLRQQLKEAQEELQRTLERLRELEEAGRRDADARALLTEQKQDLLRTVEALRAQKESLEKAAGASRSALDEGKKENELLLLQLHQVQEELEQTFLNAQKKEDELRALQGKQAGDADKLRHLMEQSEELQRTVVALRADKGRLEAGAAAARKKEDELRVLQGKYAADTDKLRQLTEQSQELQRTVAALRADKVRLEAGAAAARKKEDELRVLQGKHAADADKLRQLTEQGQELQRTVVALRADKDLQTKTAAASRSALDEGKKENELLLLQLHQVQEELEHYFLKYQALEKDKEPSPVSAAAKIVPPSVPKPVRVIPAETIVDMRYSIDGENWHGVEDDGRWAGPGTVSVLRLPKLPSGRYRVELDVVDAMAPGIVREMTVSVDGKQMRMKRRTNRRIPGLLGPLKRIYLIRYRGRELYPLSLMGEIEVNGSADRPQLTLTFPKTISPQAIRGGSDSRELAIRVRQVKLSPC